jgi:hypothetical protein
MDGLVRSRPLLQENNRAAEAPSGSYKRSFDISAGGISAARLSEEFVKDGRFRGSEPFEAQPSQGVDEAHSSLETTPQWQARGPGLQARSPNDEIAVAPANDTVQPKDQNGQRKVASVQPGMQANRERAVETQAPPYENKASIERAGKKYIVPSKIIDTAAISTPGNKQSVRTERPALSARAALSEHSLDRTVLTAAPGG